MGDMKTAIVIDDCEPIRILLKKLLQNFGYEVQDFPGTIRSHMHSFLYRKQL